MLKNKTKKSLIKNNNLLSNSPNPQNSLKISKKIKTLKKNEKNIIKKFFLLKYSLF
jgi:hypothetical protein